MCFSLSYNADSIYEAIQELFDDLGGITLELIIDNPKALVIENNPKGEDEIKYNEQALLLAAYLGTELNACNIELMQEKLLELMKYVRINHYLKTISIDNSALTVDGYKVKLS